MHVPHRYSIAQTRIIRRLRHYAVWMLCSVAPSFKKTSAYMQESLSGSLLRGTLRWGIRVRSYAFQDTGAGRMLNSGFPGIF